MPKKKPQPQVSQLPESPFWMPEPDKMLAAGFKPGGNADSYVWEAATGGDATQLGGRWWLYVWLKTKTSEIFIHHVNKPRAAQPPKRTTVGTGAEFTNLIKQYGWHR